MALTPMMQHYVALKEKYSDCFLFYRLGDFYELFFDDAVKASEILGLTLTGKDCGMKERAPMCGVPFHAVDGYVKKLVDCGEKVAICEQLENPATAKGLMDRDVVRVITAGTVTEDSHLTEGMNSFICSAWEGDGMTALAWADITTGEFLCTEFKGGECLADIVSYMEKLRVREIICDEGIYLKFKDMPEFAKGLLPAPSKYYPWAYGQGSAEKTLMKQFSVSTLEAFPLYGKNGATRAAGALLEYLNETQKRILVNLDGVQYVSHEKYMYLDNTAVRNLELQRTISDDRKYGSLLWLLDRTETAMGARLLNSFILSPLNDINEINYRLDGVEELYSSTVVRAGLRDSFRQVKDVERLSGKVSNGNLGPRDCVALAQSLGTIPAIKMQLSGFSSRIISYIIKGLPDMQETVTYLSDAIVPENTPAVTRDGGFIREGFNAELDELRNVKANASTLLTEIEARERERTGIKNLKIGYNRIFGYYIEVTRSFVGMVPDDYQRRQTLVGAERYITPELKELEEKILTSEERALKLETAIFEDIKTFLVGKIPVLKQISASIALLDVLTSFAECAKSMNFVRPVIVGPDSPLIIKDGRHPVVEAMSKEKFIANDTYLDEGDSRTIILTGPNMAGKSTYMRQTAVIAIMAHMGCFVPASSCQMPIIDKIFTRVGASDNLIMDRSTFMVEMIEVATILRNATRNSLLILDEVGRGTSTYDGLAIAWAVIEHITEKIGAKTMFATHYHELTELEDRIEGIKNYKVSVKEINGGIVFLRKIMRGGANRSFGIEVAALAGVPDEITDRAKKLLKSIEKEAVSITAEDTGEPAKEDGDGEIEKILRDIDMDSISPMQAFMILGDLCEKVKK